jgi:hypothetical protein
MENSAERGENVELSETNKKNNDFENHSFVRPYFFPITTFWAILNWRRNWLVFGLFFWKKVEKWAPMGGN